MVEASLPDPQSGDRTGVNAYTVSRFLKAGG